MKINPLAGQRSPEPQFILVSGRFHDEWPVRYNSQIPNSQNNLIGLSCSTDALWLLFFLFLCSRREKDTRLREWGHIYVTRFIMGIVDVSCSQARAPCANMKPRKKEVEEVGGRE